MKTSSWIIPGADGQPIIGEAHLPAGEARGVVLVAHGFKGYKDYGMFPRIAATLADAGFIAHRFNFSHSGMTDDTATFARPDLFERDTWNRQVFDLRAVADAVARGDLDGEGLPLLVFGHSRGGVTTLLAAGRDGSMRPAGLVTASAPSTCLSMTPEQVEALRVEGAIVSPSSRTGQDLCVGRAFLTEQEEDPAGHDLPAVAARITCPVLLIHGDVDPTVPAACARELAEAIGDNAEVRIIPGADHVYNTPNPMGMDAEPSPQLNELLEAVVGYGMRVVGS